MAGQGQVGSHHKIYFGTADLYGITQGDNGLLEGPPPDNWKRKTLFYSDADGDGRADILRTTVEKTGLFFADLNGDGLTNQFDFERMSDDADCGGRRIRFQVKQNTGRIAS